MSLFGLFEQRASPESPAVPLTASNMLEWLTGPPGDSGIPVTEKSSMGMSAAYRCTALISSVGGALPLHPYIKGTHRRTEATILDDPHPDMTPYEYWRLTYVHRCLWGNHYSQKIRDNKSQVRWLYPLHPSQVRVGKTRPTEANPSGKVFEITDDSGATTPMTPWEILHIPGLGYDGITGVSPIRLAAQGIGMALAAERHGAKLFGSGNLLSGILQTEQKLQEPDAKRLLARWEKLSSGLERSRRTAVLDSGAKFQSLTMPNDDAQFLESRRFQVTDLGRYFGVPPYLLFETEKSTSWGSGLEQQAQGWITFDLHPQWLAPTEQRATKELLIRKHYAKYSVQGLLRGDSQARAEFYRAMRELGAFSANDIRELEDRTPVPNGDGFLQPLNFVPLGTIPTDQTSSSAA